MKWAVLAAVTTATPAMAQVPEGWVYRFEGAYIDQGDADLAAGNAMSVDRSFGRLSAFNRRSDGLSFGISASFGQSDYAFTGAAPWGRIDERSVTVTLAGATNSGARWFVAPSVRSRAENGASSSAGRSAGVFAGISWQVNDRLRIGPAFGAFEGLGREDYDLFPALLLDWQMTDRWSLSTGPTIGASQGPGLSLRYDVNTDWSLTLSARRESNRFALSNGGPTPGGVGEDRSVPVVLSLGWSPNPGMQFAVFAGAEVDGVLEVENAAGATVSRTRYDAAPIAGLAFSLSF